MSCSDCGGRESGHRPPVPSSPARQHRQDEGGQQGDPPDGRLLVRGPEWTTAIRQHQAASQSVQQGQVSSQFQ